MVCVYLLVVLLTTSFTFAGVSKDTCDIHALVGHSLTIALDDKTLLDDILRWTHNNTVIFQRESIVRVGKPTDIDAAGSLLLRDLNFSSAGVYHADMRNATGVRINGWHGRVCVMVKVSRPKVTFFCRSGGAAAMLNCDVLNPRDVVFAWTHKGRLLVGETKPTLSVSLAKFKGDKDFSCSVRNAASEDQSCTVRLKCEPPPPMTYCFKATTVMAAVAGGIGLLLLFFMVSLVSCFRRNKQTRPKPQADLPMVPTTELRKADRVIPDYEVMLPSGVSPGTSRKPSPKVHGQDVLLSVAKAQEGHGTPAPEGKREPSPVPKPRTKALLGANHFNV